MTTAQSKADDEREMQVLAMAVRLKSSDFVVGISARTRIAQEKFQVREKGLTSRASIVKSWVVGLWVERGCRATPEHRRR